MTNCPTVRSVGTRYLFLSRLGSVLWQRSTMIGTRSGCFCLSLALSSCCCSGVFLRLNSLTNSIANGMCVAFTLGWRFIAGQGWTHVLFFAPSYLRLFLQPHPFFFAGSAAGAVTVVGTVGRNRGPPALRSDLTAPEETGWTLCTRPIILALFCMIFCCWRRLCKLAAAALMTGGRLTIWGGG